MSNLPNNPFNHTASSKLFHSESGKLCKCQMGLAVFSFVFLIQFGFNETETVFFQIHPLEFVLFDNYADMHIMMTYQYVDDSNCHIA